ncbi:hypothetical protein [Mangrovimonas spongiae]|uniref:Nucleotide-diphospho-sugar transferase domain-containing protein n=1 Tax=Mangrovimonas spongiae TaxID=2494697 RepID=A0A3R9MHB5_9FLAO|nr:hypothetical protein [Mangrovimonas spongiae]RSK40516.1 hypothetical protein EJA19_05940 [Mangrovimonas spongiae]
MIKNNQAICTIITADYFFYAQAIYDSVMAHDAKTYFYVLVVDDYETKNLSYKGINSVSLQELKTAYPKDYQTIAHYENDKASVLRWALKPLFLKYILKAKAMERVILVDPDIYFFKSPKFLFQALKKHRVLLTPHWRSKNPNLDPVNFDWLFNGGLYNAGFFGCNKKAIPILDWWLQACAYKMTKGDGFFVDQSYLNLMPIYFEGVYVLKHRGCNVAAWNRIECKRQLFDKEVLINGKYPVVFIHFTSLTIKLIQENIDPKLTSYLKDYQTKLLQHNPNYN